MPKIAITSHEHSVLLQAWSSSSPALSSCSLFPDTCTSVNEMVANALIAPHLHACNPTLSCWSTGVRLAICSGAALLTMQRCRVHNTKPEACLKALGRGCVCLAQSRSRVSAPASVNSSLPLQANSNGNIVYNGGPVMTNGLQVRTRDASSCGLPSCTAPAARVPCAQRSWLVQAN